MNDNVLLIHISNEKSKAITDVLKRPVDSGHFISHADVNLLIEIFCRKLAEYSRAYLCVEDAVLRNQLQKILAAATMLEWTSEIAAVRLVLADKSVADVAIANGIYPLLDSDINVKLFDLHREYRADISYAENLPAGMAFDFVSRDLLESLDIMEAKDDDLLTGIRPFVEKNINHFHAEVHYEEPDLRLLRLDFSLGSMRSIVKTAKFLKKFTEKAATQSPYAQLHGLLQTSAELLFTFPSYIELEFCATASAKSFFSPLSYIEQPVAMLKREDLKKVREYIATGLGDTSVCASGLGEPLEHPEAIEFLRELLADKNIRQVFVETNGILLEKLQVLIADENIAKLRLIVMLNSIERYAELSGSPATSLHAVKNGVKNLVAALTVAGKNAAEMIYLQALKVEENEGEIDALYALAEELGASFILQKYNRYAGLMPERRVSDMTPLERYSCWHLRRDLFIRANGDVAFCKQTVNPARQTARGNLSNDTLSNIWAAQQTDFVLNYLGEYPAHLPCTGCDEYFTFNY